MFSHFCPFGRKLTCTCTCTCTRSKLLPLLHPGLGAQPLAEAARLQELDLVQQAAFTDPSDSSAWLYHTWLAGDPALPTSLLWLAASQGRVTVAASSRVQASQLTLWLEGERREVRWEGGGRFATTWSAEVEGEVVEVGLEEEGERMVVDTRQAATAVARFTFREEPSAATR